MRRPFDGLTIRRPARRPRERAINPACGWTNVLGVLVIAISSVLFPGDAHAVPAGATTAPTADETIELGQENALDSANQALAGPDSEPAAAFGRRETLLASLTIFVLAVFLGFELITKVPPTLHTPLMSGSNAISGITLVGALLVAGTRTDQILVPLLGCLAVVMATINVVGGFAVTHRMLAMFRRK